MNYIQRDMDFFMQNQLAQSFTRCSCSKMYVGFAIQLTFSAYPHVFFFFLRPVVALLIYLVHAPTSLSFATWK